MASPIIMANVISWKSYFNLLHMCVFVFMHACMYVYICVLLNHGVKYISPLLSVFKFKSHLWVLISSCPCCFTGIFLSRTQTGFFLTFSVITINWTIITSNKQNHVKQFLNTVHLSSVTCNWVLVIWLSWIRYKSPLE